MSLCEEISELSLKPLSSTIKRDLKQINKKYRLKQASLGYFNNYGGPVIPNFSPFYNDLFTSLLSEAFVEGSIFKYKTVKNEGREVFLIYSFSVVNKNKIRGQTDDYALMVNSNLLSVNDENCINLLKEVSEDYKKVLTKHKKGINDMKWLEIQHKTDFNSNSLKTGAIEIIL
jgi:hypothetical protein